MINVVYVMNIIFTYIPDFMEKGKYNFVRKKCYRIFDNLLNSNTTDMLLLSVTDVYTFSDFASWHLIISYYNALPAA